MLFLDHYNTFVDKMKVESEDKNCLEIMEMLHLLLRSKMLYFYIK